MEIKRELKEKRAEILRFMDIQFETGISKEAKRHFVCAAKLKHHHTLTMHWVTINVSLLGHLPKIKKEKKPQRPIMPVKLQKFQGQPR